MIYNSHSWKYKMNEEVDLTCDNKEYNALVDIQNMYYSSVGFGWRLHMGRLFRLRKSQSWDCYSIQFYYEDPSGSLHEFGPYAMGGNLNGRFEAKDGSGYVLVVRDYLGPDHKIIMFDVSGRKYSFGDPLDPPILPAHCDCAEGTAEPVQASDEDKVFYVEEISDYNNVASIKIFYELQEPGDCDPADPNNRCLYYDHQISRIEAPFEREIIFSYETVPVDGSTFTFRLPRLTNISMPSFESQTANFSFCYGETLEESLTDIYEPWDTAECESSDGTIYYGPIVLASQSLLKAITLPETDDGCMQHVFSYEPLNDFAPEDMFVTGEIVSYTNPFGAKTDYYFKDVESCSYSVHQPQGCQYPVHRRYWNPSRFLYKKAVNAEDIDPQYVWEYKIGFQDDALGEYGSETVVFSDFSRYGNIRPFTIVKNPPDSPGSEYNEIVYDWICVDTKCDHEAHSMQTGMWGKPGNLDCPDDPVFENGHLENVRYYQGEVNASNLIKEESYTYVSDDSYGGGCCHNNTKVYRANIRQESKTTRFYGENTTIETKEVVVYDNYGNPEKVTSWATGLPSITINRGFLHFDAIDEFNLEGSRYKVDFLEWQTQTSSTGEFLSGFYNSEYKINNNNEERSTGKVDCKYEAIKYDASDILI